MSDDHPFHLSRRSFLKLTAATGLVAGCSPAHGPEKVIPYLVPPEHIVPGMPLFYRTLCRACGAGCGVTARTREGRVIKLEGNPEDPISRGALCARGQAEVQTLYAPERLRGPQRRDSGGRFAAVSWDEALATVARALGAAATRDAGSVRLLTRPEPGSAGALQRAFLAAVGAPAATRVVLEPLDLAPLRAAGELLFGRAELPVFELGAARTVVSFGADFVTDWLSPVELARGLAAGRGRVGPERTRLVWIGPRLSLTGVSADDWLDVRAGGELAAALAVLRFLGDPAQAVPDLLPLPPAAAAELRALSPSALEQQSGLTAAAITRLGRELATRRPSAVLGPGVLSSGTQATELAAALLLINYVLGNLGRTVHYGLDPLVDPPSPFPAVQTLVADLAAGRVAVLLVHHADPVGALPAALGAAAALDQAPLVVSFSDRLDATTRHAHLVLPDHHPLESYGDLAPRQGVVQLAQPVMKPLGDTRPAAQTLIDLAARLPRRAQEIGAADYYSFTHDRLAKLVPAGRADPEVALRAAQARGGVYATAAGAEVTLRPLAPGLLRPAAPRLAGDGDLTLLTCATALRRGEADPPWLREVPDALTTISWSSWVEVAPPTAQRLGLRDGDVVGLTTTAGAAELPVYLYPGLRPDVVVAPLGGVEPLALLPVTTDARSSALAWLSSRVRLHPTGRRVVLPRLEGRPTQGWRDIVRTVSSASPRLQHPPPAPTMYPPPAHPEHRWAMVIDVDRCTGCQACVVACYAENNIPVNGPELDAQGRSMEWLRIERYYDRRAGALTVDLLPMLCQHCGNAPCEPVCPVYATYHTAEGLNAQVYNRCVGTRYCSNNCPYKVRTFNWRDPVFPEPLNLQLNPDVTVRSKGVMEKCTFCVQRIRFAENQAKDEHRPVADGEVVTACVQACPAQALVFGDANDPRSRVAALARDPRGYHVLEDLNTQPAITYLARVREPSK